MIKNSEYEKMPKSLSQLGLNEKELNEINKPQWAVTEKIHGANFSFVYENRNLLFAKRKEYLRWQDDFFGFQEVVSKIEDNLLRLFECLSLAIKAEKYIVYGELFGGKYPHPNVPSSPNVDAIQTGIYYSPTIHFCAFDIAIENNGKKQYLDFKTAIFYFEKFNILYTPILFIGKLNDALNFNIRINSKIPTQLNLPELSVNLIEGIVIKPFVHSELKLISSRPIIKIKNPEFDEEGKFHEAEKWSFIPKVTSNSEDLSFIIDEIVNYINKNRLISAMSKIGKVDFSDETRLRKIQNEMVEDVWNDFNNNNNQLLNELTVNQQVWIKNRMIALIKNEISTYQ